MAAATLATLADAQHAGAAIAERSTTRFLDFVGQLGPDDLATRVPGSAWTAGEVLTHVESVFLRYTSDLRRAESLDALTAQNADDVARLGVDAERSLSTIAAQLAALVSVCDHIDPERRFPFHNGMEVTFAGGWGNLLGELLAHGDDIARATDRTFSLPGADLELMWRYAAPVLSGWVRSEYADLVETWDLAMPFGTVRASFDHGLRWELGPPGDAGPADHTVTVHDAAEFALAFPYRRRPIDDPTLALLVSRFHDL